MIREESATESCEIRGTRTDKVEDPQQENCSSETEWAKGSTGNDDRPLNDKRPRQSRNSNE